MSTDLAALWRDLSEDAVALGDIRVGESPAKVEAGIVLVGLDTKGQRHLLVRCRTVSKSRRIAPAAAYSSSGGI